MSKAREWFLNPVCKYKVEINQDGIGLSGNEIHVIEKSAYDDVVKAHDENITILKDFQKLFKEVEHKIEMADKLAEALEKAIKENTWCLKYKNCEHDWEPDTSMTIMRCDKCGIGLNNYKASQLLKEYRGNDE